MSTGITEGNAENFVLDSMLVQLRSKERKLIRFLLFLSLFYSEIIQITVNLRFNAILVHFQ